MSDEDPVRCSSAASCSSPGRYTPCQHSLLWDPSTRWWGWVQPRQGVPDSPCCSGMLSPPCQTSPSVSTSKLPLQSPLSLQSPTVPGDPKSAACCPSCAMMTFSCCQGKGSCSHLHWKKPQLYSALCGLQGCRFAGVPELGLFNASPAGTAPCRTTLGIWFYHWSWVKQKLGFGFSSILSYPAQRRLVQEDTWDEDVAAHAELGGCGSSGEISGPPHPSYPLLMCWSATASPINTAFSDEIMYVAMLCYANTRVFSGALLRG